MSLVLLLFLVSSVLSKPNYLFHGEQHSYNHDISDKKQEIKLYNGKNNEYHSPFPSEFIGLFEYNVEFQDKVVMIQLDHDEISDNIKHIHCSDNMKHIDLCFSNQNINEFINELKDEISNNNNDEDDGEFIISSSESNQWNNCKKNMNEVSLIRKMNINECYLNKHNNCLQCNNVKQVNHTHLIKNGYITFHSTEPELSAADHDIIKQPEIVNIYEEDNTETHNYNHKRHLNAINRTYSLWIDVCIDGGTSNDIWIVLEGLSGDKTSGYNMGSLSDGGLFPPKVKRHSREFTDIDIGTITNVHLVTYGDNEFCVEELSVEGKKWDDALGFGCECLEYNEPYPGGCEVVDFNVADGEDVKQTTQTPCDIIPAVYGDLVPSRQYTVRIDVCDLIHTSDGTKDTIYIIIEGSANKTGIHNISLPNAGQSYSVTFNDVDVEWIEKISLVTFGDDQWCIDRVKVNNAYIWESDATFGLVCECVEFQPFFKAGVGGCAVLDIDFTRDSSKEYDQIPCKIIPVLGNVLLDSWTTDGLETILDELSSDSNEDSSNYTGDTTTLLFPLPTYTITESKIIWDIFEFRKTFAAKTAIKIELAFDDGKCSKYFVGISYDVGISLLFQILSPKEPIIDIDESILDIVIWSFGIFVGPIELGVSVGVDIRAALSVDVNVEFSCLASYNIYGEVGMQLTSLGLQPYASTPSRDWQFGCTDFTASVITQVSIYPIFYLRIHYVFDNLNLLEAIIKPYVEVEIQFSTVTDGCYLEIITNYGLQIGLGTQLTDNYWPLYNNKWPLWNGCLDSLINITLPELPSLSATTKLFIDTIGGKSLCTSSYGTSNLHNDDSNITAVKPGDVCNPTELEQSLDINGTALLFGKVGTIWNGKLYQLKYSKNIDNIFDNSLRELEYETYSVLDVDIFNGRAEIMIVYNTIFEDSVSKLECVWKLLQNITSNTLTNGNIDILITNYECVYNSSKIIRNYNQTDVEWFHYYFDEMKIHLAKRLYFIEFLSKNPFQINIDLDTLQFTDNNETYYGGIWCSVCSNNSLNECDNAIKSFELHVYNDGMKASLYSNYLEYELIDLDITYDISTNITCISNEFRDIMCGNIVYTFENNGNRYYFGEIIDECYSQMLCGNYPINSMQPIFVFNELSIDPYNDKYYKWETSINSYDNSGDIDECNLSSPPTRATDNPTDNPTRSPVTSRPTAAPTICINVISEVSGPNDDDKAYIKCPDSHSKLISCGCSTAALNEDSVDGGFISDSKCYAQNGVHSPEGVYAHARCCSLPINCIGVTSSDHAGPSDDDSESFSCTSDYNYIMGCSYFTKYANADGSYPVTESTNNEPPRDLESNTIYSGKITECTAVNGVGGDQTYSSGSCCKSIYTYDTFNCIAIYGEAGSPTSKVMCPPAYFMTGCSGHSPWGNTNAWYIDDTDTCISRSNGNSDTWASAICCQMVSPEPTDNPTGTTLSPTANPTNNPTTTVPTTVIVKETTSSTKKSETDNVVKMNVEIISCIVLSALFFVL